MPDNFTHSARHRQLAEGTELLKSKLNAVIRHEQEIRNKIDCLKTKLVDEESALLLSEIEEHLTSMSDLYQTSLQLITDNSKRDLDIILGILRNIRKVE